MATYGGALPRKTKGELQELADELDIESGGTKEELVDRIKKHLAAHARLSDDPRFSGLYVKKKPTRGSAGTKAEPHNDSAEETSTGVTTRMTRQLSRTITQDSSPTRLAKPVTPRRAEIPDVVEESDTESPTQVALPPSPVKSVFNEVISRAVAVVPQPAEVAVIVEENGRVFYKEADRALASTKAFLSNAKNISSLTVVLELFFIIYSIVPWEYLVIPLSLPSSPGETPATPYVTRPDIASTGSSLAIPYPPISYIMDTTTYKNLLLWAVPTLIVPQLFAVLISFRPAALGDTNEPDSLTAAIIRIACVIAGDWGMGNWQQVLGVSSKWRLLGASVAGAFALAETLGERKKLSDIPQSRERTTTPLAIEG